MLLIKTPTGEEKRVRQALCLEGEMIFLNLQDRVLENYSPGRSGSVTGEHLGNQVELEPEAREGVNIHGPLSIICGHLLCSDTGRSPHKGNKSTVGRI